MEKITVVIPCFNEQDVLRLCYEKTKEACAKIPAEMEYLFVNDGSGDDTLKILRELAQNDEKVKYISFSRNFGKEPAIYAGLSRASGDYVVLMDADLQHPPENIAIMYQLIKEKGCDSVAARRAKRTSDSKLRGLGSKMYFKLMQRISKTELVVGATDFRMMSRQMVDAVLSMTEYNRFSKGIFGWVGFWTEWIDYTDVERAAGKTKWSMFGLIKYSLDGILSFSVSPLSLASWLGIVFCVISAMMLVFFVIKTWMVGETVQGFPTLICVIFLLGGIQLLCFGIMGQYIAKMYLETKHRPIYIEKESNFHD